MKNEREYLKSEYRGFVVETVGNGNKFQSVAYLNGIAVFGTYSELDSLSSLEKIYNKIDLKLSVK